MERMEDRIWIVGFFDIPRYRFWYTPILKKGFQHAIAMTWDIEKQLWIVVDWGKRGLNIELTDHDGMDRLIAFVERHNGTFLSIKARKTIFRLPLMPCWCVTVVRNLIGIKTPLITPWQLHCALMRRGAEPIFGPETIQEARP